MPPRSVCLNVFTSSLGTGIGSGKEKEARLLVKEVKSDVVAGKEEGVVGERGRHDSVQGSPNDSTAATTAFNKSITTSTNSSPIATTNFDIDISTSTDDMGCLSSKSSGDSGDIAAEPSLISVHTTHSFPSICNACSQRPAGGSALQRCSRCKRVYYCSKICQKHAWKLHKAECEPTTTANPSSALHTPDMSAPGSPTNGTVDMPQRPIDALPPVLDVDVTQPSHNAVESPADKAVASLEQDNNHPSSSEGAKSYSTNDDGASMIAHPPAYACRSPQPSSQWRPIDGRDRNDHLLSLSFDGNWELIANAYRLWATEHGGPAPNLTAAGAEFALYIEAVEDRMGHALSDKTLHLEWATIASDPTLGTPYLIDAAIGRAAFASQHSQALLDEIDALNQAVYGDEHAQN